MAHILVIDDTPSIRALLRECLCGAGHRVSESADGRIEPRGWEEPPDLVITDMCLGEASGLDVIRSLRLTCPMVKIIAISGGGKEQGMDILREAERQGADRTLAKPFGLEVFLSTVNVLLTAQQVNRQGGASKMGSHSRKTGYA